MLGVYIESSNFVKKLVNFIIRDFKNIFGPNKNTNLSLDTETRLSMLKKYSDVYKEQKNKGNVNVYFHITQHFKTATSESQRYSLNLYLSKNDGDILVLILI